MFLHYFLLKKTNYLIFVFSLHLIWGTVNTLGHLTEAYWRCVFFKRNELDTSLLAFQTALLGLRKVNVISFTLTVKIPYCRKKTAY